MPERKRVLVLDDDAGLREGIAFLLGDRYDVLLASHGEEALAILARERLDLILVDWMLPDMSGREVIRAAAALRPPIVIVSMSVLASDVVGPQAISAGARYHVQKPFDVRALVERLATLLGDAPPYPAEAGPEAPRVEAPGLVWRTAAGP